MLGKQVALQTGNATTTPVAPAADGPDVISKGLIFGALFIGAGSVLLMVYVARTTDESARTTRTIGRYGVIIAAFLIFTEVAREGIIQGETYVTLAGGALAGAGAYVFRSREERTRRGSSPGDGSGGQGDAGSGGGAGGGDGSGPGSPGSGGGGSGEGGGSGGSGGDGGPGGGGGSGGSGDGGDSGGSGGDGGSNSGDGGSNSGGGTGDGGPGADDRR